MENWLLENLKNNLHVYIGFGIAIFGWISYYLSEGFQKNIYDITRKKDKQIQGFVILAFSLFLTVVGVMFYEILRTSSFLKNIGMIILLSIFLFLIFLFLKSRIKKILLSLWFIFSFLILVILILRENIFSNLLLHKFMLISINIFIVIIFFILFIFIFKTYLNPRLVHIIKFKEKNIKCVIIKEFDDSITVKSKDRILFLKKKDIKEIKEVEN